MFSNYGSAFRTMHMQSIRIVRRATHFDVLLKEEAATFVASNNIRPSMEKTQEVDGFYRYELGEFRGCKQAYFAYFTG